MLASILPTIAIIVRRLRDAGYHWPYIFIADSICWRFCYFYFDLTKKQGRSIIPEL